MANSRNNTSNCFELEITRFKELLVVKMWNSSAKIERTFSLIYIFTDRFWLKFISPT